MELEHGGKNKDEFVRDLKRTEVSKLSAFKSFADFQNLPRPEFLII